MSERVAAGDGSAVRYLFKGLEDRRRGSGTPPCVWVRFFSEGQLWAGNVLLVVGVAVWAGTRRQVVVFIDVNDGVFGHFHGF